MLTAAELTQLAGVALTEVPSYIEGEQAFENRNDDGSVVTINYLPSEHRFLVWSAAYNAPIEVCSVSNLALAIGEAHNFNSHTWLL